MHSPFETDRANDWDDPELEAEFGAKLVVVASWCETYAAQCEPIRREEWLRFAAFLKILGSRPIQ